MSTRHRNRTARAAAPSDLDVDRLEAGIARPSRRGFLALVGVGAAGATLVACSSGETSTSTGATSAPSAAASAPASAEAPSTAASAEAPSSAVSGSVTLGSNYSDTVPKGVLAGIVDTFTQQTGIQVVQDGPTDYGKLQAMVQSGNVQWDVVDVEADFALRAAQQGLLEPLDFKTIDRSKIDPRFVNDHAVGSFFFSFVLGYNQGKLGSKQPQDWSALFDTATYPGKRALYKWPSPGVLELALLADGVPKDKLYPLDLDRAFKKLDTIKKDIVWWGGGAQSQQLLASGDDPANSALNQSLGVVQNVQTELEKKIDNALAPFLGMDNFRSSVTARLNTDTQQIQETVFDPESRVERSTRVTKEEQKSSQQQPDNAATVQQNIPQAAPSGGAGPKSSDEASPSSRRTAMPSAPRGSSARPTPLPSSG